MKSMLGVGPCCRPSAGTHEGRPTIELPSGSRRPCFVSHRRGALQVQSSLLFLQRTGKKQGRLARGSLSGPQAANQKLHGSGAPFGPVPLKIQCGNNGFPLRGWRSHAASAGLEKLHASASPAQQKSRRGFPAGTHFASFNFANRSFRRFVSTARHRGGICISSASCSLPSG
jgi:hypothetical protein